MLDQFKIPEWIVLNNKIVDGDGNVVDLEKDKEAAKLYFVEHINKRTRFFHSLEEKLEYLLKHDYYEEAFLSKYKMSEIKKIFKIAYAKKFRFPTYMGAFKFYNDYALKDREDGETILERYEDRLSIIALYHANGDIQLAETLIKNLINQNFTPATPILLNTGRKKRGEFVSCFLLEFSDSLNSISRSLEFAMQLSKRGGGVALNFSNLRAKGESLKGMPNIVKGVIGVGKLFDNAFRYADQMGQRTGAGVAYLPVFHPDVVDFLSTKKLNADEDVRFKTLSIGLIVPNKFIELAKENKDMYMFYPHTVFQKYGVNFADINANMSHWYDILVEDPDVRKKKISPRYILDLIAQVQGESGYPYLMYVDRANESNPLEDKIKFSNLCTEILQPTITSDYADYHERDKDVIGMDVSCNLSSGHMEHMIENNAIEETVYAAMEVMNSVSTNTNIEQVPAIAKANRLNRSVGFGIMGHHGFLAKNHILYGSDENIDLVDVFFNMINYYSLRHSMLKAKETGLKFYKFENSKYADGSYFSNRGAILPKTDKVLAMFKNINIPTEADWKQLKEDVMTYGLYNSHRLAIAPTGSISYVMSATASLTPIKQKVEERTYGNSKTYFPMPYADTHGFMYEDSYRIDNFKVIDVIATAQKHIDQGISFELGVTSDVTTRELQRMYLYAHHKGIKTLYYTRTKKLKVTECEACQI